MKYNKLQLGWEIVVLFQKYPPFMRKWPWVADGGAGVPDFLASLKEMSWMIYSKTNTDTGQQVMGREWDTDPYAMGANIMGRVLAAAQGDGLEVIEEPRKENGRLDASAPQKFARTLVLIGKRRCPRYRQDQSAGRNAPKNRCRRD